LGSIWGPQPKKVTKISSKWHDLTLFTNFKFKYISS